MAEQYNVVVQTTKQEPAVAFRFWVEIAGIIEAEFLECSGLSMERETQKLKEGGVNDHVHYLPGRTTQGHLTLKRGIIRSDALWSWYGSGLLDGKVDKRDFTILLKDAKGASVCQWDVLGGYPIKWEGPSLNTSSSDIAVETLQIAHAGITMTVGPNG